VPVGYAFFSAGRARAAFVATVLAAAVLMTAAAAQGAPDDTRFDLELRATVTVLIDSGASLADVNGDGNVDGVDLGLVA